MKNLLVKRKTTQFFKIGKRVEQTIHNLYKWSVSIRKKYSISVVTRKMQIKAIMNCQSQCRTFKELITPDTGEDEEQLEMS